jgi:hypothetical protein
MQVHWTLQVFERKKTKFKVLEANKKEKEKEN